MKCRATIRRAGKCKANLIKTNQCGSAGQDEFDYSVRIQVEQMDSQGFIIDQFKVVELFENLWTRDLWLASCEQLAAGALVALHAMASGRAVMIEVEISPMPQAGAMLEWQRGEDNLPSGEMLPQRQQRETWLQQQRRQAREGETAAIAVRANLQRSAADNLTRVRRGDHVKIIAADGVLKIGDRLDVFWVGRTKRGAKRVGVIKGIRRVFTDLGNVVAA